MPDKTFIDTSIGIKRIEEGTNGEKVKCYLADKEIFTSKFVLMEFKRTILKDTISLFSLLQEENTIRDVHWRIKKMLNNRDTKKVAGRWIILLGLLGYPKDNDEKIMKRLEYYIHNGLEYEFLKKVQLLESKTMCNLANNKPIKKDGRYELNMESLVNECCIKDVITNNKSIFEEILEKSVESHDPYFEKLSAVIAEVLGEKNDMKEENCTTLGDVVIAIDCPNDMELCTSDHHFDIICKAVDKSCYNPLTSYYQ